MVICEPGEKHLADLWPNIKMNRLDMSKKRS